MGVVICIFFKFIQFIVAAATVIIKKVSDIHSDQLFTRNKKLSMEWTLLNDVTWSREGNDFSIFTFAGYTFICAVLIIARLAQKNTKYSAAEKLFLFFGIIFFTIEGLLVYSSSEYVHIEKINYAFVLGALCFAEAFLFALDIFCFGSGQEGNNKLIQTNESWNTIEMPSKLTPIPTQTAAQLQQPIASTTTATTTTTQCHEPRQCQRVVITSIEPERKYLRTDL